VPRERLGHHEGPGDVDAEHPAPVVGGHVQQGPVGVGGGVVDQDVGLPPPRHGLVDDPAGDIRAGDVAGHGRYLVVAGEDAGVDQVADDHAAAVGGERLGDRPADAVGAAGDQGYLAVEATLRALGHAASRCGYGIVDCRPL